MKRSITFLCLLFNLSSFAQASIRSLLDSVVITAKQSSLYAATVNWDSLQTQIYAKAEDAKTIEALKPAFETLLNVLRDHHGRVINAKTYQPIA